MGGGWGGGSDGTMCPPGGLRQHLETFLVIITGGKVLLASGG